MSGPGGEVRFEEDGAVAVIMIDNPPVNAGSHAVRKGLVEAVQRLARAPTLKAGILIGHGKTFISGSDIREFGKPLDPPIVPEVIAAIENCPKPIVAAISGAALGGGYEIALACDARVALADSVVGLPEVKLGIIPGAGGTQRLPRLMGLASAIEVITSARRVPAPEALRLGMVDAVVSDLRAEACAYALKLPGKARLRDLTVPASEAAAVEAARASARKSARGLQSVEHALRAIDLATTLPIDEALREERAIFDSIRTGEEASALRHLFFAERAAGKFGGDASARKVQKVAIIGAGTMGSGIAVAFLGAGYDTVLIDTNPDVLKRAEQFVSANARGDTGRLQITSEFDRIADCDLVLEAIIEDMQAKKDLLARVAGLAPKALIASNTSYLDLNELAAATQRPQDVLGLHFFSPAHRMRLLEVVVGAKTSEEAQATAAQMARRLKKVAVTSGVAEGFIGNRIYNAYRRQCEFMVEEGASPEQVDRVLKGFGFAMGPFAVGDLSGLDIAWNMRKRLAATRDPRERYVAIADRLCEAGRLGRKTGAGWYRYADGSTVPMPDPAVTEIIANCRTEKNITARDISDDEILQRALAAIVNEACLVLDEKIAARASDIDLVLVNGYGFPASRGGPMFWASRQPPADLTKALQAVEAASGFGFRRGSLEHLPSEGSAS